MKKIEIYTTNFCPFCVKAKSLLKKKNIKFQIFADNVHIGDCDKIYKLDQEKKLDKLLGLE
ncbi:MAG: hypothetical protein EBW78_04000 [Candidatus Fonsibacter ubiquis]|nr:hypothetical protein [Candidatus Fonsibacter ubiquis]